MRSIARFQTAVLAGGLCLMGITPLQASYIVANLNGSPAFNACGSANPIDPSEPCAGAPNVASVSVTGPVPGAGDGQAATSYGINKLMVSSGGGSMGGRSEWQVQFSLHGGTVGETVPLTVILHYNVELSAAGGETTPVSVWCSITTHFLRGISARRRIRLQGITALTGRGCCR